MNTYYNPTTQRYYVNTYHNGDIDTTAMKQDARKWDMGNKSQAANFRRFDKKNGDRLRQHGFIVKEVR